MVSKLSYYFSMAVLCLLSVSVCATAEASLFKKHDVDQQRAWFKQARDAQNAGDDTHYQALYKKLENYPLRPYLDVWQAWKALQRGDDFSVVEALKKYADIPESMDLRIAWIKSLAGRGQWPHVARQLALLPHAETRLSKISILSAWYNGHKPKAFELLQKRWRKGLNIDDYHTPFLREAWQQAGYPSIEDVRARAVYFAKRKKWAALRAVKKQLNADDRQILKLWKQASKHPLRALDALDKHKTAKHSALLPAMVNDALRRLSRLDTVKAWQKLQALKALLPAKDFGNLQKNIALRSAKKHEVASADWLASLDAELQNDATRAWRVRMLLLKQDWQAAAHAMAAMPEQQQLQSRWMYWQAFALQKLNQKPAAALLFKQVSLGRGYYSFLSADRLGLPYRMGSKDIAKVAYSRLEKQAYMQRAYEWIQLDEVGKASREWYIGLANADAKTWLQALQMAASWGWYDRAIEAASRAGVYDALDLRFPMAYAEDVQKLAQETGLPRSLIWGVIRQESVFNARAVSRTGARGLMQLMPKTAKHVSKKHDLGTLRLDNLFSPSLNIRLGTLYLADLLRRFDGRKPLAVAAYNAGPMRVAQWQKRVSYEIPELWVELIPFHETRRYVQQVMAFSVVYDWRQHQAPTPLLAQMNAKPKVVANTVSVSGS